MGDRMLVLNSLKAVNELMDKRGHNYSDRVIPLAVEMYVFLDSSAMGLLCSQLLLRVGADWDFSMSNYDPVLKKNRRIFHEYFNTGRISAYHPVLEQQALAYLRRLLSDPKDFKELTK